MFLSGHDNYTVHHPVYCVLVTVDNVHHHQYQTVLILKMLHWNVVNNEVHVHCSIHASIDCQYCLLLLVYTQQ